MDSTDGDKETKFTNFNYDSDREIIDEIYSFLNKIKKSKYTSGFINQNIDTAWDYLDGLPEYSYGLNLSIGYHTNSTARSFNRSGTLEIVCGDIVFDLKQYATIRSDYGSELDCYTFVKWGLFQDPDSHYFQNDYMDPVSNAPQFISQMFDEEDDCEFSISVSIDEEVICEIEFRIPESKKGNI